MFRDDDLALLTRPLYAFLTVAPREGRWPAPRPVWFEATAEGTLQMFSEPETHKIERLREQPRASVVVASPVGEPEHWVSVEGPVTVHEEGAYELAARLGERYWPSVGPEQHKLLDEWRGMGVLRIVVHPERVNRFTI
ncbi:pyridoxamine 5'-phosphate oxidase family protein [Catenuloplanes atrovinosus]|uniref:General stress protein 26 n=1 Tax=Catenuloplanes atrovinosus TaxID=137266 RepID=A0AAE3YNX0_9ACTN|nr:pyridoxamine 5'-phosphate oxidase family protein [Catenuloplanes atrovinosus]MDR7276472.1 general stress protein 26 [Catenuloplanes atrovinosus]